VVGSYVFMFLVTQVALDLFIQPSSNRWTVPPPVGRVGCVGRWTVLQGDYLSCPTRPTLCPTGKRAMARTGWPVAIIIRSSVFWPVSSPRLKCQSFSGSMMTAYTPPATSGHPACPACSLLTHLRNQLIGHKVCHATARPTRNQATGLQAIQ
jgi:hypothetical protein